MPSKDTIEVVSRAKDAEWSADDDRFFCSAGMTSDSIEVHCWNAKTVGISIDNPWSGSTESGFGQNCSIDIPIEAAEALARHILKVIGK